MRRVGKPVRWTANLAAFLLAFAAVTRLLTPAVSTDRVLRAKLDHFQQHKDEYDLVFFGSSRIYRAFDPQVFCKEIGERADGGRPLRAFNFGVGAMRPHEMNAIIRRVQASEPARLRWVLIELMHWEPTILEGMSGQPRTIDWHDLPETWSACRTEWLVDRPVSGWIAKVHAPPWLADLLGSEKPARCGRHLLLMANKHTNWGGGPQRIREWFGEDPVQASTRRVVARGDGFVAIDDETGAYYQSRRQRFLTEYFDIFLRQIAEIPAEQRQPATLEDFNVVATLRQQAAIRAAGAEPIYVVPNLRDGTPVLHRLSRDGVIENFIALNDPEELPELYDPDHYFDRGHLNRRGAELFSAELARRFADRLKEQ